MEINITLIIQMLVFVAFIWFTMRFVWPPLSKALEERQAKIADGLAAAERGRKELELSQFRVKNELKQAKIQANSILDKATERAAQLIEEARAEAKLEIQKQTKLAQEQLKQEINHAKTALHDQIVNLAIVAAEKILTREINQKSMYNELLDQLIGEI